MLKPISCTIELHIYSEDNTRYVHRTIMTIDEDKLDDFTTDVKKMFVNKYNVDPLVCCFPDRKSTEHYAIIDLFEKELPTEYAIINRINSCNLATQIFDDLSNLFSEVKN